MVEKAETLEELEAKYTRLLMDQQNWLVTLEENEKQRDLVVSTLAELSKDIIFIQGALALKSAQCNEISGESTEGEATPANE